MFTECVPNSENNPLKCKFDRHFVCVKGARWQWELWFEDVDFKSSAGPRALDWPNIKHPQPAASGEGESTKDNFPKDEQRD